MSAHSIYCIFFSNYYWSNEFFNAGIFLTMYIMVLSRNAFLIIFFVLIMFYFWRVVSKWKSLLNLFTQNLTIGEFFTQWIVDVKWKCDLETLQMFSIFSFAKFGIPNLLWKLNVTDFLSRILIQNTCLLYVSYKLLRMIIFIMWTL